MPKGNAKATFPYLFAFDTGNGKCRALSSELRDLIGFEPVIAPMTRRSAVRKEDEKPTYSLQTDNGVLVFGVDDVFEHGRRDAIRRLNSIERYTDPDYFYLVDVLFLNAFKSRVGNTEALSPTGVISLPVSQFNNEAVKAQVRKTLVGEQTIRDYEGCALRLRIEDKRLIILPESYGALMHYSFDPTTLRSRADRSVNGSTLVVDIGYETTDCSLYEGLKYQRDRALTIPRAGMGIISRAVTEFIRTVKRSADVSRVDVAMQAIAGVKPGAVKWIEPDPGIRIDIQQVYDEETNMLANRIAQDVRTYYTESVNRILLGGGGAYHLSALLTDCFDPQDVVTAPDPDDANVRGAFTMLNIQAAQKA